MHPQRSCGSFRLLWVLEVVGQPVTGVNIIIVGSYGKVTDGNHIGNLLNDGVGNQRYGFGFRELAALPRLVFHRDSPYFDFEPDDVITSCAQFFQTLPGSSNAVPLLVVFYVTPSRTQDIHQKRTT